MEVNARAGRNSTFEGTAQATQAGEANIKGSDGLFRERNEVKYSFITQKKKTCPIGLMCQLMDVSRSAYYNYVWRAGNRSEESCHEEILGSVRDRAKSSNYTYGSRRIRKALNALDYPVGR